MDRVLALLKITVFYSKPWGVVTWDRWSHRLEVVAVASRVSWDPAIRLNFPW